MSDTPSAELLADATHWRVGVAGGGDGEWRVLYVSCGGGVGVGRFRGGWIDPGLFGWIDQFFLGLWFV